MASSSPNRHGYRGYICARMDSGRSVPQHIQQLVMRDYCAKRGMHYLLAFVEYLMPGCTMVLDAAVKESAHLEGIVMYSVFLLPDSRAKRMGLYRGLFANGCTLHFASENIRLHSMEDAMRLEESRLVMDVMRAQTPSLIQTLQQWDAQHA